MVLEHFVRLDDENVTICATRWSSRENGTNFSIMLPLAFRKSIQRTPSRLLGYIGVDV